jgi:hypothetical protein
MVAVAQDLGIAKNRKMVCRIMQSVRHFYIILSPRNALSGEIIDFADIGVF